MAQAREGDNHVFDFGPLPPYGQAGRRPRQRCEAIGWEFHDCHDQHGGFNTIVIKPNLDADAKSSAWTDTDCHRIVDEASEEEYFFFVSLFDAKEFVDKLTGVETPVYYPPKLVEAES
jgi:hypothetical protein